MKSVYFVRRILSLPLLLALVSFLAFLLVRLMPGGPFDNDRRPASPEIERNIRAKYHLDDPWLTQYGRYLGGLLHGDFGPSLRYRDHSVTDVIEEALPVSLTLGCAAFCFAIGVGIPAGFYGAARRGRWPDYAASLGALLVICVPALVIGPILVMVFAVKLRWFPVALWGSPWHAVLPTLTLGLFFSGRVSRLMREGMRETMRADFITTARAKGLGETAVLLKHAFRGAVTPVLTYAGPLLADLLTGSFVVENLFQIPGIGVFMVNSSLNRDYTMAVGLALLYAALLLVLNLAVDFTYAWLDPRVRYE